MNDPQPIIETDTLRGARSVPLAPVITRERGTTRDHTPWRNNGDADTTSDYHHDPHGVPRRVTTLNLDQAARNADIHARRDAGEAIADIASRHELHRETVRRILNNEHQDQP